jgi:4-hydroxy-tetrahydrodipicolinate reductase
MIRICVSGSAGRMGRAIISLIPEEGVSLGAALEREGHALLGTDAGALAGIEATGVFLTSDAEAAIRASDVVVDFSAPASTMRLLELCIRESKPLVIGTTGLSDDEKKRIQEACHSIPVLLSPNMAVGVNVLFALVEQAARMLRKGFDVEIAEIHHHFKKDAPSGTAVRLKDIVRDVFATEESEVLYGRKGMIGERRPGEIGVHALRGGDVVGEHTVFFFAEGERIELTHRATSRTIFARGALRAAKFLSGRPPGSYTMMDVLQ